MHFRPLYDWVIVGRVKHQAPVASGIVIPDEREQLLFHFDDNVLGNIEADVACSRMMHR